MTKAAKQIPALSEKDKERFFSKIPTTTTDGGCLEWKGGRVKLGYGQFKIKGKLFCAHRVAHFLATGIDPLELCVCHSCDNPPCVNPAHLWLGTVHENNRDRNEKGRSNPNSGDTHYFRLRPECVPRGEAHTLAKLTASDIPIIRADSRPRRVVAAEYGVAESLISRIRRRESWAHVA